MIRYPRLIVAALSLLALPASARAETIFFQNGRSIEARSYEIKGPLIYLTMTNGKRVYLRADSVDWEGTKKLKSGGHELRKVSYEEADADTEVDLGHLAKDGPLTSADLKRGGYGFARRKVIAIPRRTISVGADLGWVDSRIDISVGGSIEFRADGTAELGGGVTVGPGGRGKDQTSIEPNLPHGALLMRIGLGGTPMLVGGTTRVNAPATGRIYLCVNDKSPEDNSGGFQVSVQVPNGATPGSASTSSTGAAGSADAGRAAAGAAPPAGRRTADGMVGSVERSRRAVAAATGSAADGN